MTQAQLNLIDDMDALADARAETVAIRDRMVKERNELSTKILSLNARITQIEATLDDMLAQLKSL